MRYKLSKLRFNNLSYCHQRWLHSTAQLMYCKTDSTNEEHLNMRFNDINIQLLSENLHKQIFKGNSSTGNNGNISPAVLKRIQNHLEAHQLWGRESTKVPDVDLKLPALLGDNLDDHFRQLASEQLQRYLELAGILMKAKIPKQPTRWSQKSGWTKYDPKSGEELHIDFPDDKAIVFDMEVIVQEGNYPTMATAVSSKCWYSWCSDLVNKDRYRLSTQPSLSDLIPLETAQGQNLPDSSKLHKRLVIGHNVGFDRSFVKEQYYIKKSRLRFLDTMSLNIAVCGQTSFQRVLHQATLKNSNRKEVREHEIRTQYMPTEDEWKQISTKNSLKDVYKLHCDGELEKEKRDIFVTGTMEDVRNQYQELMTYCANDVEATYKIYKKLFPQFLHRFPHPVTLAGMLEMGTAYLPINKNWDRYIRQSDDTYTDLQRELKLSLMRLADHACQMTHGEQYKNDPWLWDLDWNIAPYKMKIMKKKSVKKEKENKDSQEEETADDRINKVWNTADYMPKRVVHMAGCPKWYRDLCPRRTHENWKIGPSLISTQMRIVPKLLRLTWEGYPLHYSEKFKWGYAVPDEVKVQHVQNDPDMEDEDGDINKNLEFPTKAVFEFCGKTPESLQGTDKTSAEIDDLMYKALSKLDGDLKWEEAKKHFKLAKIRKPPPRIKVKKGYEGEKLPGCHFLPLPHKDGAGKAVGNPLGKDFISKFEVGILQTASGANADQVLKLSKTCSYWKNNKSRIGQQMAVRLQGTELSSKLRESSGFDEDDFYGAIIPRIVPAGTVTRRAVESTWLTASNAHLDRIGSELKAIIQSPPGYKFVGADVDSQELWIAALLGDSHAKVHGCTAFGWMTLQGNKNDKTDLHSKTAESVNITRDHAKIFNYSRIYGAGRFYAERMLVQFNPRLSESEAKDKAIKLYGLTKGKRVTTKYEDDDGELHKQTVWKYGSESEMFNKLEAIAKSDIPQTPVLGCRISKALEPEYVGGDFMTSRVNWVVQSSAVDYLHLMLVCMNWLIDKYDIDARFAISIHDEVRYLVSEEDRYRAALALQITNLMTRSIFAYKLGMMDLPQSVAFFSAVDIDTCMRKEVSMDCKTPSNPHGLESGYTIPPGEALGIYQIIEKTGGKLEKMEDMLENKGDFLPDTLEKDYAKASG